MTDRRGDSVRQPLDAFDPYRAHVVDSPNISYSGAGLRFDYRSQDDSRWVRVVFDRCDAFRVCRGEYPPYRLADGRAGFVPVSTVTPSTWLEERAAYRQENYGDVDHGTSELEHFVFSFHDEFVEVLAAGVHAEFQTDLVVGGQIRERLSWTRLPNRLPYEQLGTVEHPVFLRESDESIDYLVANSQLAEQLCMQVDTEPDSDGTPFLSLAVREQAGVVTARFRKSGDLVLAEFDGMPPAADLRELVDREIEALVDRRQGLGL